MDVGLFGGSFNPPHVAHQIVAETVREQFALDAVWWMPAGTPPHKEAGVVAAAPHRLEMARRATASNPGFEVRGEEVERDGPSYTIETLRVLEARHPEARFALVIGGDSLASFSEWRAPVQIARRAELLVYRRPGDAGGPEALLADLPEEVARRVRFAEAPSLAVAGTDLRERRRQGRSLRYLVPEAVRTYIHEHDLYAGEAHPAVAG